MNEQDYYTLNIVMSRLQKHLGQNRFCIIPYYQNDSPYMAVYDTEGKIIKEAIAPTIAECVDKLLEN